MSTSSEHPVIGHDKALGLAVDQQMFLRGITRTQVAQALGLSQPSISRKISGKVPWTVEEISLVAMYLNVETASLLPTPDGQGGWLPAPFKPGYAKAPALAGVSEPPEGIEPSTYSLRVNRSAD